VPYEKSGRRFYCTIGEEIFSNRHLGIVMFSKSKLRHIKKLVVKRTLFPHRNIHNYIWTSPDGKTHNQIDHILIDRRWNSSIQHVRSFMGVDCDADHYLVVSAVGKDWQLVTSSTEILCGEIESHEAKSAGGYERVSLCSTI
jgi:hypothetical protein